MVELKTHHVRICGISDKYHTYFLELDTYCHENIDDYYGYRIVYLGVHNLADANFFAETKESCLTISRVAEKLKETYEQRRIL